MRNAGRGHTSNGAALPCRAGTSLKAEHYEDVLAGADDVAWLEVHPENYMGAGGPPHHFLSRIRERFPLSLHGVGLSIGGAERLDSAHLRRLRELVERYSPAEVSEHLAWSSHGGGFLNDLLPLPYTHDTLKMVCAHIDELQNTLRRRILLENPSTYVAFSECQYSEPEFLSEICRRTGCGLLLDVNNVFVQCNNRGWDAVDYVDLISELEIGEIHLAGHAADRDDDGSTLLIDSHDRPVIEAVWKLFAQVIGRIGRRPTLIEWDEDIPAWPVLLEEARKAEAVMSGVTEARRQERRERDGVA